MHAQRAAAALAAASLALAGCSRDAPPVATGGDPARGRALVAAYECGVCHRIPGVRGARGVVGPPLAAFGLRSFIAGRIPNTPPNLVAWVTDPPRLVPETAMPALGLDDQQARDVAAYLYQLR
ncbi:MAG: cytochrome C1 [Proteobacteria bacterium]|nr:MAG: cytochrome C1 [Pseudomonadota bacterium]